MDLTVIQKEILQELINIYEEKNRPVKGTEIAKRLNRNPGTIRNQMQALKALNLVDGVPGPRGGYIPTSYTYKVLGLTYEDIIEVPIYKGDKKVEGVCVEKIIFDTVAHEKACSSMIQIRGDTRLFKEGDIIRVGPTYHNKIVVFGKVIGRDDINHILLINVMGVASVPNIKVETVAIKEKLIWIEPTTKIKDTARILYENSISGVPVISNGKLVGVFTYHDLAHAISKNMENQPVEKVMTRDPITITPDKKIYDALILMEEKDIGRLIVVDKDGRVVGIITKTDVLKLIGGALFNKILKNIKGD
ncbi:MAG TPA: CBS domain-containing protein [Methanothermococcus okinawensis]|uniref:Transcriptional regulator n=1 Tax=Methanofervidicoccus abyssi TaxID=2082189 RepID=A0A401HNQ0_9EURY|nr:CBS domain-containing protein [Methanofervidicoccus abyssi]GBF35860.1 transcriptional regulator [Methanofervidicoccus abyssi]HIP16180.1 CBS domain-containing protein [Methanothermococcus okinawensis]HIP34508.1 CBS domain-containing protein [Methanothermococcus okinawensis]